MSNHPCYQRLSSASKLDHLSGTIWQPEFGVYMEVTTKTIPCTSTQYMLNNHENNLKLQSVLGPCLANILILFVDLFAFQQILGFSFIAFV